MRFLSTLLRTTPDVNQLPMVAVTISTGLHQVKLQWFEQCVFAMQKGIQADFNEKARVIQTEIGGTASLAITGYQLYCVTRMLEKHSYIPKTSIKMFLDLLFSRITGNETSDLLKYIRRFEQVHEDTSAQQFRLAVEVARYVTNQEPSMMICLHVSQLVEELSDMTSLIIADNFGDIVRADRFRRKLRSRK